MRVQFLCLFVFLVGAAGCGVEYKSESLEIIDSESDTTATTDDHEDESMESGEVESAAKPSEAEAVLAKAIASAKAADKNLFVHFGADWWGWCGKLEKFLDQNNELFKDDFHFVKITTDHMEGGQKVMTDLLKGRSGGMPWMVILDGDGKEVISSSGPEGNVGCPVLDSEIDYFIEMIKSSSDATDDHLGKITTAMKEYAKKLQ